ncbi:MAG: hypothetical protein IT280_13490 [Ignavibacteria bacterium]|nr:hypothetical protein [Ignavibacteria bacterium]
MKTILYICLFTFAITLINSCGDDTSTNNNGNPCNKSISLATPPDSSVFYLVNHTDTTIKFTWLKATCVPEKYIFEIGYDENTFPSVNSYPINDTSYTFNLGFDSVWYFWRTKAVYSSDTITTPWRFLKYFAN